MHRSALLDLFLKDIVQFCSPPSFGAGEVMLGYPFDDYSLLFFLYGGETDTIDQEPRMKYLPPFCFSNPVVP